MKVWTFGDSWGAGWGLLEDELRLDDHVARHFKTTNINKSESGSSLGQITWDFHRNINKIKSADLVLVIVPPDIRWYREDEGQCIKSLYLGMEEYNNFIKGKTELWFHYHHSLFLFTIFSMCRQKGCKLLMQHNYGELVITPEFAEFIPNHFFIDKKKSLTELLGSEDWKENYDMKSLNNGPPSAFIGEYFIPGDTHPNAKGHKKIAEFFLEKYNEVYK